MEHTTAVASMLFAPTEKEDARVKGPSVIAKAHVDKDGMVHLVFPQSITVDMIRRSNPEGKSKGNTLYVTVKCESIDLNVVEPTPEGKVGREKVLATKPINLNLMFAL